MPTHQTKPPFPPPLPRITCIWHSIAHNSRSGLGFAICCRTIDAFLSSAFSFSSSSSPSVPAPTTLTLIFTTRSARKSADTQAALTTHLAAAAAAAGVEAERVRLVPEQVDLAYLPSVRALVERLLVGSGSSGLPVAEKIDALVLNAGVSGFVGLDWGRAVWTTLTDLVEAMTWPTYARGAVGVLAGRQTSQTATVSGSEKKKEEEEEGEEEKAKSGSQPKPEPEPALGQVFCSNVFGHYMLSHYLMPLLSRSAPRQPARIVWVSSLEATAADFQLDDLQALETPRAYQSSKYLTDLLSLTSNQPSSKPYTASYTAFQPPDATTTTSPPLRFTHRSTPNIYTCHPGICGTAFVPLLLPLVWCMLAGFYLARLFGSPWHVVDPYKGALPAVWLAFASQPAIDAAETSGHVPDAEADMNAAASDVDADADAGEKQKANEQQQPFKNNTNNNGGGGGTRAKWGAACDRWGRESIVRTQVDGWGFGALPLTAEERTRVRRRGAPDLATLGEAGQVAERVSFEEQGRKAWQTLEGIRGVWERILEKDAVDGRGAG